MDNLHTLNRLVHECFNVEVALCLEDFALRLQIGVGKQRQQPQGEEKVSKAVRVPTAIPALPDPDPTQGNDSGRMAPVTAMAGMVWLAT